MCTICPGLEHWGTLAKWGILGNAGARGPVTQEGSSVSDLYSEYS